MKNLKRISSSMLAVFMLVLFNSCDSDSELFTITNSPTAAVLAELSITDIELDAVNVNNPAVTLNWAIADYGQQASINYAIQFASDAEFTSPVTASSVTGNNSVTLSMSELNAAAGNAGLNPFVWAPVYVRVVSSLGTQSSNQAMSNVITFNVYPYFNYVFSDYYLVGNATAPDWNNNNNNPPLFRNPDNADEFTFVGHFNKGSAGDDGTGRFKVLETKGLWQPQWGTAFPDGSDPIQTGGDIAGNPGTQSDDPGRFGIESSGNYTFTINFATRSYSMEPYAGTAVLTTSSLTLQGSSVTAPVTMTQQAFDSHIFYANAVRLTPGSVEFITDSSASWGGSTEFSGTATAGGGSINVPVEDDYDVWFNALTGQYILIPLNL